ncbi:hypothetical protein ACSLBF_20730 (plasmid) [Pseudoalteromonas sp. T1lg65]|uniref:hypothetical protein n=1 Tax=Pseudoalteromonas sp. T1lg65 TaxID=2077101 RepID=UPI003F7968E9
MKLAIITMITFSLVGCAISPNSQSEAAAKETAFPPITSTVKALIQRCKNAHYNPLDIEYINADQLNQFIENYCSTQSTTKQLNEIEEIKHVDSNWPESYIVWFEHLTLHTQQLRTQRIDNFYLDRRLEQAESEKQSLDSQLKALTKQLKELKLQLAATESERLMNSSPQAFSQKEEQE